MAKIHVLDEKTASKIAAGEVIERPAGVLKELLENAIDAGASVIRIAIENAGKTLLRVNDNGCGMSAEDLRASVLRHATSKIASFDDLEKLHTFGFRGEALYSIAAVSRLSITSCTGEGTGQCLEIHAGKVVAQHPAPAIKGTTLEIRDLFFNTPARLKFLKSDSYERACLLKVVEESALANPAVSYYVSSNGREVYNLPAQDGDFACAVGARARAILGEEVAASLLYRSFDELGLHLFITPSDKLVSVRDMQYVFVNRRPIDSKTIRQAIYKAYQHVRAKDRHPAFLLYLTLPPADFDVNIHPQKREVRFVNESHVFSFIMHATGETVFSEARPVDAAQQLPVSLPPAAQAAAEKLFAVKKTAGATVQLETVSPVFNEFEHITNAQLPEKFSLRETTADPEIVPPAVPAPAPKNIAQPPAEFATTAEPTWFVGPYHYLGQLQRSYLLFENPLGLVLIDQHAAQERVLFEQYLHAFDTRSVSVQELLFPLQVDLPPSNVEALLSWASWLKTAGFEIEPFSARTVTVRTRPHVVRFKEADLKEFIVSLAQVVGDPAKSTETLKRRMVAMLACKKAVKAHDSLTAAEAEALVDAMKKCKDGMHCPHGRPCVAQLHTKDIDKLFGR